MVPKATENYNEFRNDDIDLVRRVMEDMLLPLFYDEPACHKIGFTQVSRLLSEMPGWYFWTKNQKGTYLLELVDIKARDSNSYFGPHTSNILAAEFGLRYYPHPEEDCFKDYAFVERRIRLGSFFDQTGTPISEKRKEIDSFLFTVGDFRILFNGGLQIAGLSISAQEHWVEVREDGLHAKDPLGHTMEVVPKGGIDRNVPGWELSWNFFDKIVLGFCYVHRCCPIAVKLTKSRGDVYHTYLNGEVIEASDTKINRWTLETGILLKSEKNSDVEESAFKKVLIELTPEESDKNEAVTTYFANPTQICSWIDSDWWFASSWVLQPNGEICHCCFRED